MSWTNDINEWILENPLPCGDSWDITKMSATEIKIERLVSVAFFHARNDSLGIFVSGKNMKGRFFSKRIATDASKLDINKLIALLMKNCGERV